VDRDGQDHDTSGRASEDGGKNADRWDDGGANAERMASLDVMGVSALEG